MGKSLYKSLSRTIRSHASDDNRWVFSESAIVADTNDPEKRHRIKVSIPTIDEDLVYDDWIAPATPFSFGDGFGSVFLPKVGIEVLITGVLGQKYNFVYHGAVYNEENKAPELGENTQGMKVPGNLTFIAILLMLLQAQNIRMIAEQLAHIEAQNIEIFAEQLAKMTGQNTEVEADQLAKMQGSQAEVTAENQLTIHGGTVTVNSDGSITIQGGGAITIQGTAIQITGSSIKLFNRTVAPIGPTI